MSGSVQLPVFEEAAFTPEQLAHFLGTQTETLWKWRRNKKGPLYYRIGRRVYYKESDVTAWLESHKGGA